MSRQFAFYALDLQGRLVHDVVTAEDEVSARIAARSRGADATAQLRELSCSAGKRLSAALSRPSSDAVTLILLQLAALCEAGLPLLQVLNMVSAEASNPCLRLTLEQIADDVSAGGAVAQSCARHSWLFDHVACGLLAAAEADGRLDEAFRTIAKDLEQASADRRELISAVSYPLVCLATAGALTVYLGGTFLPRIVELYSSFDLAPPAALHVFATTSTLLIQYGPLIAFIVASLAVALVAARRHEPSRRRLDGWVLQTPGLGGVVRAASSARFAGTLGRLYGRGVTLLRALEVSASVVGNGAVRDAVLSAQEDVRRGYPLADALARSSCFSPNVAAMVRIGEASGSMEDLLLRTEQACREEWRRRARLLTATLRRVLLVVVALSVSGLIWALYMPILHILPRLSMS